MIISKKLTLIFLVFISMNVFSQDYEEPELKDGVKDDILTLISGMSDYFVVETEAHYGLPIVYLLYTDQTAGIFNQYGETSSHEHDSSYITSNDLLISIGNDSYWKGSIYYQCVQFVQAISDVGLAKYWLADSSTLDKDETNTSNIKWKIIAKFNSDGSYDGTEGGHVALALSVTDNGVYVIDQNWEGDASADYGKTGIHLLPWSVAENYSVVTRPVN